MGAPGARAREPWTRFKRRHRQARDVTGDFADPSGAIDAADGLLVAVAIVVAALVFVFLGLPALIALGELLLLLLLALGGVVARVLFRRPWTVDALGPDGEHHEWRIVGWRASGEARDEVARHLEASGQPPTGL